MQAIQAEEFARHRPLSRLALDDSRRKRMTSMYAVVVKRGADGEEKTIELSAESLKEALSSRESDPRLKRGKFIEQMILLELALS